jgi:TonB-dependent receptor
MKHGPLFVQYNSGLFASDYAKRINRRRKLSVLKDIALIMKKTMNHSGAPRKLHASLIVIIQLTVFFLLLQYPVLTSGQNSRPDTATISGISEHPYLHDVEPDTVRHFGDYTVADALIRLAGVQAGPQGQVNLRGVGFYRNSISVNGQRHGSTIPGLRAVDLSGFPLDVFRSVEWIRVVSPDMEAEGAAGRINLNTDIRHLSGQSLSLNIGGGANPSYYKLAGPAARGSVQYSTSILERLQLTLSAGYQQEYRGREGLSTLYGTANFGDGPVDVAERISPFVQTSGRDRAAGSVNLRFRPDENQQYYLRAYFGNENREFVQHTNMWMANGNWVDETTTGFQGRYGYNLSTDDFSTNHYSVAAGGHNSIRNLRLDYNLGWSFTELSSSQIDFEFHAFNLPYTVNLDDRDRPQAEPVNNFPQVRDLRLQPMQNIQNRHTDNSLSGALDLTIPVRTGYLKVGTRADLNNYDAIEAGEYSHFIYNSRTPQTLIDFDENRTRSFDVLGDDYRLPWLLNPQSARRFFSSSIPAFATNDQQNRRLSDIWNHAAAEKIFAGYAMFSVPFSKLQVTGGVRIEHTTADYTGREVTFDRFDRFVSTIDTTRDASSTMLFPNVRLLYDISSHSRATATYSRTYNRHDYRILAPFVFTSGQDTTRFRGNPGLDPLVSENVDVMLHQSISNSGNIYAGAFFKRITNFAELRESRATYTDGDLNVFNYIFDENPDLTSIQARETQYVNSDREATVYGFEIGISQRLSFLPSLFRNVTLGADYLYTRSEFDTGRDETTDIPYQVPHMLNLGFNYTDQRFFLNIDFQWAAESLVVLQDMPGIVPAVSTTGEVYFDQYEEGWQDLSLTTGLKLSSGFTIWAHASNLIGGNQYSYYIDRHLYPSGSSRRIDRGITAGLRFSM